MEEKSEEKYEPSYLSKRERRVIALLAEKGIGDVAEELKVRRSIIDVYLWRIRNKYVKARNTVNEIDNMKRNPRLAKILRRQH